MGVFQLSRIDNLEFKTMNLAEGREISLSLGNAGFMEKIMEEIVQ